jgi:hypothetical protein
MTTPRIGPLAALLLCLGGAFCGNTVWADDYQEGSRLYKDGKRAEALDRLNAYLAQHPKDARARFLSGVILSEQNKVQDAIKVFTELTQDYPELPEPYNNLAVLYAGLGDYDKARKALEGEPDAPKSCGRARKPGRHYATLASQAYDKALQLDNNNATARKKLALIKKVSRPGAATPAQAETAKTVPETPAPKAAVRTSRLGQSPLDTTQRAISRKPTSRQSNLLPTRPTLCSRHWKAGPGPGPATMPTATSASMRRVPDANGEPRKDWELRAAAAGQTKKSTTATCPREIYRCTRSSRFVRITAPTA